MPDETDFPKRCRWQRPSIVVGMGLLLSLHLLLVGCGTPPPVGVHVMDAASGFPLPGVEVQRRGKESTEVIGKTDESGHLFAIPVHLGDRLSFGRSGYQPRTIEIGFSDAQPVKYIPGSTSTDHPRGIYAADPDEETMPYAADRTIIVLMRAVISP